VIGRPVALAATEDWSGGGLEGRIDRAATELATLMESGFAERVNGESWGAYQHGYGSAGGTELEIDLDSALMRFATGGAPPPRPK
jgi:FMN reductase